MSRPTGRCAAYQTPNEFEGTTAPTADRERGRRAPAGQASVPMRKDWSPNYYVPGRRPVSFRRSRAGPAGRRQNLTPEVPQLDGRVRGEMPLFLTGPTRRPQVVCPTTTWT